MSEMPFDAKSRIAIDIESTQIAVAPGSSTTIEVTLRNNGLMADTVRLHIDGISPGWVSTPSPHTQLEPGEQKEVPTPAPCIYAWEITNALESNIAAGSNELIENRRTP